MNETIRIIYIQPSAFYGETDFCTEPFLRISNYLNVNGYKLNGYILEEYLDLRFEDLPNYAPENISKYRKSLKGLLNDVYIRFPFDVVAISCYTSFSYLNTLEVVNMIKHFINPLCNIVVGGVHTTIIPDDFYPENIPSYFNEFYPEKTTPIDYIVIDEGEIPFFHFIQNLLNKTLKKREDLGKRPIILERELLENLDDLPPLNLELFRKYASAIEKLKHFHILFSRGCAFRCKFCNNSETYIKGSRIIRHRSLENCIADLKTIINTDWLKIEHLFIADSIFCPKRSRKRKFFEELDKIYHNISFRIYVFERIETCSIDDLKAYKKYNMIPGFGLESCSKKLLFRMGKINGKNAIQIKKGIDNYLDKTINLIKISNKIDLPINFFYLLGMPGTDQESLNESWSFFFEKTRDKEILMEKYKINLQFYKYSLFPGNTIYNKGEEMFGARYYYRDWWKIFDKNQAFYSLLFDPSKELSCLQITNKLDDFVSKIFKTQSEVGNPFYTVRFMVFLRRVFNTIIKMCEETLNNIGDTHSYDELEMIK